MHLFIFMKNTVGLLTPSFDIAKLHNYKTNKQKNH